MREQQFRPQPRDRRPYPTPEERYARIVADLEALAGRLGPTHETYVARQARRLRVYGHSAGLIRRDGE